MRGWLRILLAIGVALAAARVDAHHDLADTYRLDQTVTVEGEVARVLFRNPHSLVYLVARDKRGREVQYAVEWEGAGELQGQGVTSQTLKVGDYLVVTGNPGLFSEDHRLRMITLRRPTDNYNYDARRSLW